MLDNHQPALYNVEDIQKIFNCGKNKAYEIIHSRGFPKMKVGRQYYIVPSEFEKWLKANANRNIS